MERLIVIASLLALGCAAAVDGETAGLTSSDEWVTVGIVRPTETARGIRLNTLDSTHFSAVGSIAGVKSDANAQFSGRNAFLLSMRRVDFIKASKSLDAYLARSGLVAVVVNTSGYDLSYRPSLRSLDASELDGRPGHPSKEQTVTRPERGNIDPAREDVAPKGSEEDFDRPSRGDRDPSPLDVASRYGDVDCISRLQILCPPELIPARPVFDPAETDDEGEGECDFTDEFRSLFCISEDDVRPAGHDDAAGGEDDTQQACDEDYIMECVSDCDATYNECLASVAIYDDEEEDTACWQDFTGCDDFCQSTGC